jgi:glycosyltransferase involved in cell wall biosynthesis
MVKNIESDFNPFENSYKSFLTEFNKHRSDTNTQLFDGSFLDRQGGIARDANALLSALENKCQVLIFKNQKLSQQIIHVKKIWFTRRLLNILLIIRRKPFKIKTSTSTLFIQPQVSAVTTSIGAHLVRIHDIFPLTNPEWFPLRQVIMFKSALKSITSRSTIIFDSKYSKDCFNKFLKIETAGQFVLPCEIPNLVESKCGTCNYCLLKLTKYVLAVGTLEPRKNYRTLIEAWKKSNRNHKLVIVGGIGWKSSSIHVEIDGEKDIINFPDCCDGSLRELYENCALFISVSLDEGFNIPVFEARKYSQKVLISDIPVHREFHEGSVKFVQKFDVDSITREINSLF